jgi:hypothetical protein
MCMCMFYYDLDSQPGNITKKRDFVKRSNSDSEITYCLLQKYSETDSVFNITGKHLKVK